MSIDEQKTGKRILVTGISGFIGSHCALDLLQHGYNVRGTLRDMTRVDALQKMFAEHGADLQRVEFAEASLTDSSGWLSAATNCDGIFHIASPVHAIPTRNPDDVIEPARLGTRNVLNAAKTLGINRVILTSSYTTIVGVKKESRQYSATDWSDPRDKRMTAYAVSKTVAEQLAWQFCDEHGLALTTIHPGMVLGPALEADYGTSLEAIAKLLRREVPLLPRFGSEIVDVRDVATLHRLAFENDAAIGQRLIAANGFRWLRDVSDVLRAEFPDRWFPRHEMPTWMTGLASLFLRELNSISHEINLVKRLDNKPAKALGWEPRSPEVAIRAAAWSLISNDIV